MHEKEIAKLLGIHEVTYCLFRKRKLKFSLKRAKELEKRTEISFLAWLCPEKLFNPLAPELYENSYPPQYLNHLSEKIQKALKSLFQKFPQKPKTKSELKKWKTSFIYHFRKLKYSKS